MTRKLIRLDVEDKVRALGRVELFEECSEEELAEIAATAHLLGFDDGELIIPEGEEGLGFYLIMSGTARVIRGEEEIDQLSPGGFFGEVALIEGTPRTASVYALGHTVCLGLLRSDFRALMVRHPRIAMRILEEEGRRLPPSVR